MLQRDGASLDFCSHGVLIGPKFEVMGILVRCVLVKVFDNYDLLTCVPIPPSIACHDEGFSVVQLQ